MNYLNTGKVDKPILSLYAFHLRNSLEGNNKTVENANYLWDKIQEVITLTGITKLENLPQLIADNEKNNQLNQDGRLIKDNLIYDTKQNNLKLRIGINPLKFHDTYAADLTLAYPLQGVKLRDLSGLNPDNCLLTQNINSSLGQTLVFIAQPSELIENEESLQKFADACLTALLTADKVQELKIKFQDKGKLLGSPIFEYNNNADSPQEQCHILIWLKTNPEITNQEKLIESYYPLIELLLCRSKIVYARNEAILYNQEARDIYAELVSKVKTFNSIPNEEINSFDDENSRLNELKQWVRNTPDKFFKYAHNIGCLKDHKTTIRTNTINYQLNFEKIRKLYNQDDLKFLSAFLKLTKSKYIQQITIDLEYLISGQELFEYLAKIIRRIVEIEEVERDRSLERTIQVFGVALGTGAIVGGVVTQHIDKPVKPINFKYPVHPIVSSLFWSVLATISAGFLTWVLTKRKVKNSNTLK